MMWKAVILSAALAATGNSAKAAPAVDENYVKSLAAPGKTVLVVEYYDGEGDVAARKGFASAAGYKALSGTDFRVDGNIAVHLYGLEACKGDVVNRSEDFSGSCADYAKRQLEIVLQSPKVLFCRAFITEVNAPVQNATCYGYYNYPGAMDAVMMLEEQLVSVGGVRLSRKADGTPERPDLLQAEDIGKKGSYGIWADPRVKGE
jgi:hypothetical protein